jgi:hypothetical protein
MRWAALPSGYFLSELDAAGAGAAGALGAAAGGASLLDDAEASTDETSDELESLFAPESLFLSFSREDFGFAWL